MGTSKIMQELIGKHASRLLCTPDHTLIAIEFADGSRECYAAVGDCCSESWFHHIEGSDALSEATIREIEATGNVTLPGPSSRQEYDDVSFVCITTDKGRCVIELRNASNGYYSGEIVRIERDHQRHYYVKETEALAPLGDF